MYIETSFNHVKVTFELKVRDIEQQNVAKNVAKNLTERQKQIIALINENPQTTRANIAAAIGVATKTIERELATLSDIVRYVGSKKGGYWEIIEN
ncbi:MAG: HTH domain-containing protein [Muribaculum sp.]|nr:HTH domain-containing protein [Muribaculum sp.]